MSNDSFFVGVSNPQEIRKDLLLSSRQIVEGLMSYEKYKEVREQKLALVHELKATMDGLVLLNRKLRSHLPKVKVPKKTASIAHEHMLESEKPAEKKSTKKHKVSKKKTVPKKSVPARKSRLEQLKEDFNRLDAKLSKLE